jgi:ribosomal protein S18 acetylase RimI-like enzyme
MASKPVEIVEMTLAHYEAMLALLQETPGMSLRDADSREGTARYLARNPGLSFVAVEEGQVVGCAMAGHDGRRGYLQHVVVLPAFRGRGVAQQLVARCLKQLEREGIRKVHLDVLRTNEEAIGYWSRRGWQRRDDLQRFSLVWNGQANA